MPNRPFHRLHSDEQPYHSPSPSQEFDIGYHSPPAQVPQYNPVYNSDYATYMNSQYQQHYGPNFRGPFNAGSNGAYRPVGQNMEEEKRPLHHQRTQTEVSLHSQKSSASSRASKILTPLMVKPWHHAKDRNLGTIRVFSKGTQARKIFIHGLIQFIPPAAFSACMALILYAYDKQSIISHREKYTFNALLLGFTLLLGFSVQSSFKLYADLMRWRFLASSHWDLKTFERIMGSSSQRTVVKLLWNGRTRGSLLPSRVQVVGFIYLFFAVGLQVVIACLGLCYSVETSQTTFQWTWGDTTISDLSNIRLIAPIPGISEFEDFIIQSGAANTYGLTSTQFDVITNPDKSDTNYGGTIYTDTDKTKYWYQFLSYCADPNCNVWQSTDRSVSANATCREYQITNDGGYLGSSNTTYTDDNGYETWFNWGNIPVSGTTTYAANMDETCGPRCTQILALNTGVYKNASDSADYPPQLFICNNTMSTMHNIPNDPRVNQTQYQLGDKQARIFAGSIGYAGSYWSGLDYQLRNYAYRSYWSWDFTTRTETDMAQFVSQYSIGAVAALDQNGPRVNAFGSQPKRAITVQVKWMFTIIVLAAVPGSQLLFLFFVMWFTRHIVIRDGSFLGNARLLRPIANELGDKGCAMDGDDIAEAMENVRIAYGVRLPAREAVQTGYAHAGPTGPLMHLDILREGESVSNRVDAWQPGMPMPEGRYDGYENATSTATATSLENAHSLNARSKRRLSF